jgi:hypothetical protein
MTARVLRYRVLGVLTVVLWLSYLAATASQQSTGPPPSISKTFILTQAICQPNLLIDCPPQQVPQGATVQIQLPGNYPEGQLNAPPDWKVENISPNLRRGPWRIIPSKGRISNTNSVYLFDFIAERAGQAMITMRANPPVMVQYTLPAGSPGAPKPETRTFKMETLTYYIIVQ